VRAPEVRAPDAPEVHAAEGRGPHGPETHTPEVAGPGGGVVDQPVASGRPAVADVPTEHWGDPLYDPANPRYDGTPRGEQGYVGTVDPDQLSASGLTDSGRLHDPNVVPEALRPYVDSGVVVNDNEVLRLAEDVQVVFDRINPNHDLAEFTRQLDLQERSLNQMSVDEWTARFDEFVERVSNQGPYRRSQVAAIAERLEQAEGLNHHTAVAQARAELAGQDPLHGPDQIAGGNPDQFTAFGDRGVNRSIGRQWRDRIERLGDLVDELLAESGLPMELRGDVRLGVELQVVDRVGV
jgi:hypothetical protein